MIFRKQFLLVEDNGGAGGGAAAGAGAGGDSKPTPEGTPAAGGKTYTDTEVNAIIKGKQSEAVEKLLKDLGIESTGKLKDDLKSLKEFQDKNKTDLEKQTEALKGESEKRTAAERERDDARAELEAIKQGVPAAKAARLVKIAAGYEGDTIAARVEAALVDFPEFKTEGEKPAIPNVGGKSKGSPGAAKQSAEELFRASMGLKPKV